MNVMRCPSCGRVHDAPQRFCAADGTALRIEAMADPLVGRVVLERYRIEATIGHGGMGVVYRARDVRHDGLVAVKVMRGDRLADPRAGERFEREAQALFRLRSPHVVRIVDRGTIEPEGLGCIVTEHVDGETLRARLARVGRLPTALALAIVRQAAAGMAEAHQAGLVHRDLKPSNLLLVDTPGYAAFVKIIDFGVAADLQADARLTRTGEAPGTPAYIAPEAGTSPPDVRMDVYALGAILHECLTGRAPTHDARPAVDGPVAHVVARALAQDPRLRHADAGALLAALDALDAPGAGADAPTGLERTGFARGNDLAARAGGSRWAFLAAGAIAASLVWLAAAHLAPSRPSVVIAARALSSLAPASPLSLAPRSAHQAPTTDAPPLADEALEPTTLAEPSAAPTTTRVPPRDERARLIDSLLD